MKQTILFKRYIWLVDLIYRHDGITRDEINRQWSLSLLNDDKEKELPERTFHRHKEAIQDLFGLEIVCDRHGDKTYHISNRDGLEIKGLKEWLLNSVAINNIVQESQNIKNRILLEPIPSGQRHLTTIIEAMKDGKVLEISYQSFHMSEPKPHEVEPFCLKIYKQRWYLLGRRADTKAMRIFALDRIKQIIESGKSFKLPKSFDAERYFEDSIGIIVEDDLPAQTVTILACNGQQNYIRSLPLHHTQKEVEIKEEESVFTFVVQPNYDLMQELMRYGEDVTVIKPTWFRDKFRETVKRMIENYKEDK